uniref:TNFR-Cys domain-containing protein n=1 Tax=Esox lucius TaxID=8010 RepID=A0AAY5LCK0_ESOLU
MEVVTFFVMISIVPVVYSCDPETQYEKDNTCCKMCMPGTRMTLNERSCLEPTCLSCEEGEYQPVFTQKTKCELQPFCDQNKNFQVIANRNKTIRIECRCKAGHYCSTKECLTCVPHTQCGPGQDVVSRGDHIQDTVCRACPANTFSSGSSAESKCKPWTKCEPALITKTDGTAISDVVCGKYRVLTITSAQTLVNFTLDLWLTFFYVVAGRLGDAFHKAMGCCMVCLRSNCLPGQPEHKEGKVFEKQLEQNEALIQVGELQPQHPCPQTPVEDDVNDSQAESYTVAQDMTENGHVVAQEEGKAHHTSVCDSQMSVVISL